MVFLKENIRACAYVSASAKVMWCISSSSLLALEF